MQALDLDDLIAKILEQRPDWKHTLVMCPEDLDIDEDELYIDDQTGMMAFMHGDTRIILDPEMESGSVLASVDDDE